MKKEKMEALGLNEDSVKDYKQYRKAMMALTGKKRPGIKKQFKSASILLLYQKEVFVGTGYILKSANSPLIEAPDLAKGKLFSKILTKELQMKAEKKAAKKLKKKAAKASKGSSIELASQTGA